MTAGDITTISGFQILIFDQKLCNACGEKLLRLLCSQIYWDCNNESLSIKYGTQLNSSQTSVWSSQESHYTGAPVRSHESGGSCGSTVSKGLRSLLALSGKMEVPVLITTTEPFTAIISTLNHFPDFRPC